MLQLEAVPNPNKLNKASVLYVQKIYFLVFEIGHFFKYKYTELKRAEVN